MQLSSSQKHRLKDKYGEWAIVTGATSGIGLELATQLAGAGFNLVIHGRNHEKLKAIANDLTSSYPVQVIVVAVDLSEAGGADQIIAATAGLQVGLLIASAGFGTSGLFADASLQTELNMLRVNCEAVLSLTHYCCRRFKQQKGGGIIFLSSVVAFQGVPYAAHYAATKAYIQSFAEALAMELKPSGIDVLAAAPGPVESGFGQRANMNMGKALQPSEIGVPILKALGRTTNVFPGLLSKILVYSLRTLPRRARVSIMQKVMGGFTQHQRL
jgi:short-subunit dehydrogenase